MKVLFRLIPGMLALLLVTSGASAVPIEFTFHNVVFNDGGTITGSFDFDPTAGTYSNVDVVTTLGAALTGTTYLAVCGQDVASCTGVSPNSTEVLFLASNSANQSGNTALALFFTGIGGVPPAGLSATSGPIDISNSSLSVGAGQEAFCSDAACSAPGSPSRTTISGTVAPTPLPAALPLFAGGLGALGLLGWRRKRKQALTVA